MPAGRAAKALTGPAAGSLQHACFLCPPQQKLAVYGTNLDPIEKTLGRDVDAARERSPSHINDRDGKAEENLED